MRNIGSVNASHTNKSNRLEGRFFYASLILQAAHVNAIDDLTEEPYSAKAKRR